jgi:glucokinase
LSAGPWWLGADVGGTKTAVVRVDGAGRVAARARFATGGADGPEAVFARLVAALRDLLVPGVRGVGAGFPGLVDVATGRVRSSIMLDGFAGFPLRDRLSAALDLPAAADNDATAACVAEFAARGSPRGLHLALLTVGTGVGGALVLDGRLHRGRGGLAGEAGNTTLDWRGEPCRCGAPGCVNTLAAGPAMAADYAARRARSGRPTEAPPTLETCVAAAEAGDADARAALRRGAEALGALCANLINLLNPDAIALTGGVLAAADVPLGPAAGDTFLGAVRASARTRAFAEALAVCAIEPARAGPDAGAVGAALLARDAVGGAV